MEPAIHLDSGIRLAIQSRSDWDVFAEIFVNQEYDLAIGDTLRASDGASTILVVDLGANVGFFSNRVAHLAKLMNLRSHVLTVLAFEGNPKTFETLTRNVSPHLNCAIKAHLGLIGRRTGSSHIYSTPYTGANSVVSEQDKRSSLSWRGAFAVPSAYIDLSQHIPAGSRIDLLKCDIEGSEEEFLRNYPEILQCTDRLVIEFHPRHVDTDACHKLILRAGLIHLKTLRQQDTMSLSYFIRSTRT